MWKVVEKDWKRGLATPGLAIDRASPIASKPSFLGDRGEATTSDLSRLGPLMFGELLLMLWLLIMGAKPPDEVGIPAQALP